MRCFALALLLFGAPSTRPPEADSLRAGAPVRTLVIKDATIVVGPGKTIQKGTVVVRDGLIDEVGDAQIPADAEVVEGKGLHVYAGFIDGRTTLGLPDTKRPADQQKIAEGEKPDFTKEAPPRMEQANRKGLRPDLDAAELVNLSEADLKKLHAGGFAAAVVAPAEEFLSGRAAALTLSGAARRNALLQARTGLHAAFKSYGEGYPGTTMGALAHLRQILLDADHDRRSWEAFKPGRPRPAVDPALQALQPVLRGDVALFFEANGDREILRVLGLAEEFNVRVAITGGTEAWRVADLLAKKGVIVVLSLKLPKDPAKRKDADPEPEKLKKERERLRLEEIRCAQRLVEAGVRVVFSTHGLPSPGDALPNVATMVENGLPAEAALRALTATPAEILGLGATHGTVEKGKAANLAVLTAPLGDKKARVKHVIADGKRFDYEAKAPEDKKEEKKDEKKPEPAADLDVEIESDRIPKTRTGGDVAIRNATILTLTDRGTIREGTVLVRAGKIAAAGTGVEIPEGIRVVDGTGLTVMPGIIDCHSHIAVDGGLNEGTQSITPEVRVKDVLDPRDLEMYRALAGGVTTANILHGSANSIGGQNAVIKLRYGARPDEILFRGAPQGVKFALGENPKQSNFTQNRGKRFPNTRMGVEAAIRRAFNESIEYDRLRKEDPLARRDLRLEALSEIRRGEIWVHCHCYRADEILMILDVAKEHKLRLATLQHVLEGYRVAPEMAALGVGGSTFSDWWAYKIEAYEAIPHNAALMARAGVLTSINSDSPEQIRHLGVEAAKTMKHGGLTEDEALATVTLNPARQLGIDAYVGSIAPGKDGDLALFNGHPLSPYSRCVMTLIDGEVRFEDPEVPRHSTLAFDPGRRPRQTPRPPPSSTTVAITKATIHPVTAPPFVGTLLLRNGKIAALGPEVAVPSGTEVLPAEGLHVYPGLIDSWTTIGLTEIGSVAGTRDESEIGGAQPDLKVLTAVNPHGEILPVTRANGITSALTVPLGGGVSGQSAVIRLAGWVPREMSVKDVYALHVDYPALDGTDDKKADDEKKMKALREPFEAAKRYTGTPRDLSLEAMQPYLKGERPVVFFAHRAREIRGAIAFAEEFKLKPVIAGGREAWKEAARLAEKKVPVILAGVMALPDEAHDPYDAPFANASRLSKAGVRFAISGAEHFAGNSRNTPYHAAWAAAYGLERQEALKAVTLYPAEILGIADRLGSLEAGKDADLIVTTGDPLEVVTDVVYSFIGGRAVHLDSKHTRLYDKFKGRMEGIRK